MAAAAAAAAADRENSTGRQIEFITPVHSIRSRHDKFRLLSNVRRFPRMRELNS
jgi:hypothetical protein